MLKTGRLINTVFLGLSLYGANAFAGGKDGVGGVGTVPQAAVDQLQQRLQEIKVEDIPQDVKSTLMEMPLSGMDDEVLSLYNSAGEEGVKPLMDHMQQHAESDVCRMNTTSRYCMKNWVVNPCSRESWLYPLSAYKATFWIWNPEIARILMQSSFSTHLTKQDWFSTHLTKQDLFGADMYLGKNEKKSDVSQALEAEALPLLIEELAPFSQEFIEKMASSPGFEGVGDDGGEYLMKSILYLVFNVDMSGHRKKLNEIREHFRGAIETAAILPAGMAYQGAPNFIKKPYIWLTHSKMYEKNKLLLADVDWLVKTVEEQGFLDDVNYDSKYPECSLLRELYKKSNGVLTEEDKYDLLNTMLAGADTKLSLLNSVFAELASKQDAQQEIRAEVVRVLLEDGVRPEGFYEHKWTYEQIKGTRETRLPVLHHFLDEVLLHYPPAPLETRRVETNITVHMTDTTKAEGDEGRYVAMSFKKGETVVFPVYYLNPWEGNPNPFIPDAIKNAPVEDRIKWVHSFGNPGKHESSGQGFERAMLKLAVVNMMAKGMNLTADNIPAAYDLQFSGTLSIRDKFLFSLNKFGLSDLIADLQGGYISKGEPDGSFVAAPLEESVITPDRPPVVGEAGASGAFSISDFTGTAHPIEQGDGGGSSGGPDLKGSPTKPRKRAAVTGQYQTTQ